MQLVNAVTPYLVASASAYGAAVLTKTQDEVADATVSLGRRLAQRIFGVRATDEEIPEALVDIIDDPDDADNLGALRKAVRKALTVDHTKLEEVGRLLGEAPAFIRLEQGAQAVTNSHIAGDNIQIGSIGQSAYIKSTGQQSLPEEPK
jgi:hypothetical protein